MTEGKSLIMSESAYAKYVQREEYKGNLVRVREGKGLNNHALLAYDLLRDDIKQAIKDKYFNGDEPHKHVKHNVFKDTILPDMKARMFFADHILEDSRRLPLEMQTEYCTNAAIFNAMQKLITNTNTKRRAMGGNSIRLIEKLSEVVNTLNRDIYPHTLPANARSLERNLKEYLTNGYASLISGKFCNKNTEKINEVAKAWMLARWMNQIDRCANETQLAAEYVEIANLRGWKPVKVGAIYNYLHREDIKELWYSYRYGELNAKEKYGLQFSTKLPSMRDSLWYGDGTKLNYFYKKYTEVDGKTVSKIATCQVYEVIDTYSEMLLGYCISDSEDYKTQFAAYKMAMQTSGQKPYEIKFDNQGGHKKLMGGDFLKKLAHVAINTQPYNGKSKTIESIFGRFQSQILKKDWFFTGQNITTKKEESRANMEFILANADKLHSLDEIKIIYAKRREEWNNAAHFLTGMPRKEMYFGSQNPKSTRVEMHDMVEMFWITRPKEITVNAYGISFEEKGTKYDYLIYKSPMVPDQEWHRKNIDKSFVIKFDPEDLSIIQLFEKDATGLRFVAIAETKIVIHRNIQEQEKWERPFFIDQLKERDNQRVSAKEKANAILEQHGMLPEQQGFRSAPLKGIESSKKKKQLQTQDIAQVQKEISNAVVVDDSSFDSQNIFDLY